MEQRIGIIGGGPGGLTLARILSLRGIHARVFERDAHPLERPQGGSLDLHEGSGLDALELAGLMDAFRAHARYEDQGSRIYDSHGRVHLEHKGGDDRPEIDRTQLRTILLESLPEETVVWGARIRSVEPSDSGYRVVSEDGRSLGEFDLVVGADGAWSRVRSLVSSATPEYSGVTFIEMQIDDVDHAHPDIAAMLAFGKISVIGGGHNMIAQRSSNGHVRLYLTYLSPQSGTGVDVRTGAAARADIMKQLADWSPQMRAIIAATNDTIAQRVLVALPPGFRWPHREGVTLLGDAAHVMSPFGGDGVNLAMHDAADLAVTIAEGGSIAAYEDRMAKRAEGPARGAAMGLQRFASVQSAAEIARMFAAVYAGEQHAP